MWCRGFEHIYRYSSDGDGAQERIFLGRCGAGFTSVRFEAHARSGTLGNERHRGTGTVCRIDWNGFAAYRRNRTEQPSDWFDVYIDAGRPARIRITVSEKAAQISGNVMSDRKGVAGAPVFLSPAGGAGTQVAGDGNRC